MKEVKKWFSSILLLPVVIYIIINNGKFLFIDYLNLIIHEGGHGIFKPFGKFMYTIGGTLIQITIPLMFIIYYWVKKKKILTQIFLLWLGENLLNISIYAADAQAQKLPLLGGRRVYHDWTYILSELGILYMDNFVGKVFFGLGIITFIILIFLPKILKDYRETNIN